MFLPCYNSRKKKVWSFRMEYQIWV